MAPKKADSKESGVQVGETHSARKKVDSKDSAVQFGETHSARKEGETAAQATQRLGLNEEQEKTLEGNSDNFKGAEPRGPPTYTDDWLGLDFTKLMSDTKSLEDWKDERNDVHVDEVNAEVKTNRVEKKNARRPCRGL